MPEDIGRGEVHGSREHETLFETARGRLTRCGCCGALEVRFGNALIALHHDELGDVLLSLAEAEASSSAAAVHGVPRRDTVLVLNDSGCGWVFDREEAAELHRLLAGARLLLELPTSTDHSLPASDA